MKHFIRTLACGAALFAACGGRQTMASKSAAAYDEAAKKGIPIEAGEHGGHEAAPAPAAPAATKPAPMAEMNHAAMAGMDHSKMDHSKMPAMDHSKMPGMDHSAMPGMQHGSMPGMQHGAQPAAPLVIAPPASNAAIVQTQPATTLQPDELDAPAPASVEEAAKARRRPPGGGGAS